MEWEVEWGRRWSGWGRGWSWVGSVGEWSGMGVECSRGWDGRSEVGWGWSWVGSSGGMGWDGMG